MEDHFLFQINWPWQSVSTRQPEIPAGWKARRAWDEKLIGWSEITRISRGASRSRSRTTRATQRASLDC
jgi:hypothetical protein